jgi:branched-chain amino acid transport system substrate-binding protein
VPIARIARCVATVSLAIGLAPPLIGATAAASGEPVNIDVIMSLTGSGAFIGSEEAKSLQLVAEIANKQGGIRGRPVRFSISDDQSNPSLGIQLLNQAIAKHVAVLIGPAGTATCKAGLPLVKENGPVIFCLTGNVPLPANGYAFGSGIFTYDLMASILRYIKGKGWSKVALITSTDASGQDFEAAFDFGMNQPGASGLSVTAREHFNPTDLTVAAQVQRLKNPKADIVIGWTAGTAFGTLLRGYYEAGIDVPLLTSNANVVVTQLEQYASFMPKQLLFPGFLGMVRGAVSKGPLDDAQAAYVTAVGDPLKAADVGYNIAWDPAWHVIGALRKLGPDASASAIRDYLLQLHGYAGINGIYDFRDGQQRGIRENGTVILRWDPAQHRYIVKSRPGGAPK